MKVQRVIRWFEKDGDALVGELMLNEVELRNLQKLFNVPDDNPMYDCYEIRTKEQIGFIQQHVYCSIEPWSYDYFLECNAT